ncbi:MAG: hypothetical protein MHMPM18_003553 [Marteilia pararefringens]
MVFGKQNKNKEQIASRAKMQVNLAIKQLERSKNQASAQLNAEKRKLSAMMKRMSHDELISAKRGDNIEIKMALTSINGLSLEIQSLGQQILQMQATGRQVGTTANNLKSVQIMAQVDKQISPLLNDNDMIKAQDVMVSSEINKEKSEVLNEGINAVLIDPGLIEQTDADLNNLMNKHLDSDILNKLDAISEQRDRVGTNTNPVASNINKNQNMFGN